jgi:phosphoenolpyruvate synthase/pyruvate phosphate dikinase
MSESEPEEIKLVFVPTEETKEGLKKAGIKEQAQKMIVSIDEIVKWFSKYKIESIELNIEAGIQTGKLTELLISAGGKGGCKITLKPN